MRVYVVLLVFLVFGLTCLIASYAGVSGDYSLVIGMLAADVAMVLIYAFYVAVEYVFKRLGK